MLNGFTKIGHLSAQNSVPTWFHRKPFRQHKQGGHGFLSYNFGHGLGPARWALNFSSLYSTCTGSFVRISLFIFVLRCPHIRHITLSLSLLASASESHTNSIFAIAEAVVQCIVRRYTEAIPLDRIREPTRPSSWLDGWDGNSTLTFFSSYVESRRN